MIALTFRIRYSKSFVNLHSRKKDMAKSNTLVGKHHIIDVLKGQYHYIISHLYFWGHLPIYFQLK